MSFLKAEWRKLTIANYIVDPEVLNEYLPYGTELDLWQDNCYVSLVGFMFLNTRVLGLKIPFHVNFEEVNLRFYVKRKEGDKWKRGVVFIKEIVPKKAIAFIANRFYSENYVATSMDHQWNHDDEQLCVKYDWTWKSVAQFMKVKAKSNRSEILPGSEEEFITEHYWGFAKVNDLKTNEYEVTHPRWQHYKVRQYEIEVDFGLNYGPRFSFLNDVQPTSVMLAEGSKITVEGKRVLR